MKAIVLAAGYATRLYPLTIHQPKALLPIAGKPILNYIADQIVSIPQVNEMLVISNHKFAPHFLEWKDQQRYRCPITIVDDGTTSDENKLGAIGDIHLALEKHKIQEDVLIIAGDTYFTFSLHDFYSFYEKNQKDCFLAKEINDPSQLQRMGVIEIDTQHKVIGFEEKPKQPKSNKASFAGYIYRKDTLPMFQQYLNEGGNPDAPGFFPAWLYKKKDVYAYVFEGDCFDIGTPESYHEVNEWAIQRGAG